MKKYRFLLAVLLAFFGLASTVKAQKTYYFYESGKVFYKIPFADVDSITLDPIVELDVNNITMFNINDSCRLGLHVEPEKYIDYEGVNWVSSNEDVALIRNGYVIPVSEGVAEISGTYGGRLVSCFVNIIKPVESVYHVRENTDEFVDLGLPSGTLWAKHNIGATKPEEAGDFIAWGELEPKAEYTSQNYKWPDIDKISNNRELYPVFDVCTQKLGERFCLPSNEQLLELVSCDHQLDTLNGVKGLTFTGPNGNSIFLPIAIEPGDTFHESYYLSSHSGACLNVSGRPIHMSFNNGYKGMLARPVYKEEKPTKLELSSAKLELYLGSSPASLRIYPEQDHFGESEMSWTSSNDEVATVKDGIVTPVAPGHCVVVCHYEDLRAYCEVVVTNRKDTTKAAIHEYVDLGLPSGNLWATTNIGAESPISYGDDFSWGNVLPNTIKGCYTCGDIWWGLSISELMDKNVITKDTVLAPLYDAAKYNWGDEWTVPTKADFEELLENCEIQYTFVEIETTMYYNKKEEVTITKFIGPNGNELILPNAGHPTENTIYLPGRYWTSTPNEVGNALMLYNWGRDPYKKKVSEIQSDIRGRQLKIRPVMKPNKK